MENVVFPSSWVNWLFALVVSLVCGNFLWERFRTKIPVSFVTSLKRYCKENMPRLVLMGIGIACTITFLIKCVPSIISVSSLVTCLYVVAVSLFLTIATLYYIVNRPTELGALPAIMCWGLVLITFIFYEPCEEAYDNIVYVYVLILGSLLLLFSPYFKQKFIQ